MLKFIFDTGKAEFAGSLQERKYIRTSGKQTPQDTHQIIFGDSNVGLQARDLRNQLFICLSAGPLFRQLALLGQEAVSRTEEAYDKSN